ncbi:YdcF family protein [Aliiroseovarius sp.]|uniref:YdcF family protein n=1 Tax=Aliiroseovarius sp. TaxID=1872442 RepID=UPI002616B971|nr:YdcF family protein [Aliiroseovarius sp.]
MSKPTAIILGAAVWPGGVPSPTLRLRAEHGARLYLDGRVSGIIASGGMGVHPPAEAAAIRDICINLGVPEQAIQLEDRSTTTSRNLAFSQPMLPDPTGPVVIVTDLYHLPRAHLVARRLGMRATGAHPGLKGRSPWRLLKMSLRELVALAWYLIRPQR